MHDVVLRSAMPEDICECVAIRGRTRENAISAARLAELGITAASWAADVASGVLRGRICDVDGRMVGYCFGSILTGEIVVLALLADHEGRGLGRALLEETMGLLRAAGHERLFLGCSRDPAHRSHGFYRHLGWRATGAVDAHADEVLEYLFAGRKALVTARDRSRPESA